MTDLQRLPSSTRFTALLEFSNIKELNNALKNNNEEFNGGVVQLQRCQSTLHKKWNFKASKESDKIYVSNLSERTTKNDLRTLFSEVCFL